MIVELQKVAFPLMAAEGVYWRPNHLKEHLKVFPEGQFVAEYKEKKSKKFQLKTQIFS